MGVRPAPLPRGPAPASTWRCRSRPPKATSVPGPRTSSPRWWRRCEPCSRRPGRPRVLSSFVTKEHQATFRATPGSAAHRAATRTRAPGLVLAGGVDGHRMATNHGRGSAQRGQCGPRRAGRDRATPLPCRHSLSHAGPGQRSRPGRVQPLRSRWSPPMAKQQQQQPATGPDGRVVPFWSPSNSRRSCEAHHRSRRRARTGAR